MTTKNLRDAAKAVLKRKFIATQSYPKKQEKRWLDNLMLHLKQLEKGEQQQPKKKPKIKKERNHKVLSRNKWKRNERNNSKINKLKAGSLRR